MANALHADQRLVEHNLRRKLNNSAADRQYDILPNSRRGKIISVDVARFLAPEFATWDGRLRHTPSTSAPAGTYAHDRLLRELARPKARTRLLITAGGAGAGKTSALRLNQKRSVVDEVDLVFDNQMRDHARATRIIETALKHGWSVRLLYVHRRFPDVVPAVAERSLRTGRWNRLEELPDAHLDSRVTFLRLLNDFEQESRISMQCIVNASLRDGRQVSLRLSAELARARLSEAVQTSNSRTMMKRKYEKEVQSYLETATTHLTSVQAATSNLKDFLRLIG
jgi:hypothetical protein